MATHGPKARIKRTVRRAFEDAGWYVKPRRNLPTGIDWMWDLKRFPTWPFDGVAFDVGANVGQTCRELRRYFPALPIHAFEPVPATMTRLREAAAQVGGVTAHNLALGAHPGSTTIYAVPDGQVNSLADDRLAAAPGAQAVTITIDTVDRFCEAHGIAAIAILKTDTEGYDAQVLAGARAMLASGRIGAVVSEVTFDPDNALHTQFAAVQEPMLAHGFALTGLYDTETLRGRRTMGSYCNALFVRRDLHGNN